MAQSTVLSQKGNKHPFPFTLSQCHMAAILARAMQRLKVNGSTAREVFFASNH